MNQKHFNKIWRGFEEQNWRAGYNTVDGSCMCLTPAGNKCAAGHLATAEELALSPLSNVEIIRRVENCGWHDTGTTQLGKLAKLHDETATKPGGKNFPRDFKRAMVRFANENGFKVPA
jgi:hypothetical protein